MATLTLYIFQLSIHEIKFLSRYDLHSDRYLHFGAKTAITPQLILGFDPNQDEFLNSFLGIRGVFQGFQ